MALVNNFLNLLGPQQKLALREAAQNQLIQGQQSYKELNTQQLQNSLARNFYLDDSYYYNIPKKKPSWKEKYGNLLEYNLDTDTYKVKATGEIIIAKQLEAGYVPCFTNVEWLERQISNVTRKIYD